MNIEIIAIGDELLDGSTVNSNAAFISKKLSEGGYRIDLHLVVSDDPNKLKEQLQKSLDRSSLVITTGGLGPTFDDLTKKVVSELFSLSLEYSEDIAKDLSSKFGSISSIQNQATVPKGAKILTNRVGTAPGFVFRDDHRCLMALPGVPQEMQSMFLLEGFSYVQKYFPLKRKIYHERVNLCLLKEIEVEPFLKKLHEEDREIDIGIYPFFGGLKVGFSIEEEEERAKGRLERVKKALIDKYLIHVFYTKSGKIEEAVRDEMIARRKTLSFGESCSGGGASFHVTSLPDASCYFLGSVVAYSNDAKRDILNVSVETLQKKGAVSRETVEEMIEGLYTIFHSDFAVAISGIAGPCGGTLEKPVGTVYIAVGKKGEKTDAGVIHVPGDRKGIVEYTINFALGILWRRLVHNLPYFDEK